MFPEGRALEFLIAGVIALIVVGPKDLPVLMRKLGRFMAKMRAMAAEFRASFDEMARQSELDELRKEVEAMRHAQLADIAGPAKAELEDSLADIGETLSGQEEPSVARPPAKPRARRTGAEPAKPKAASKPRTAAAKPRARKTTEPKA